MAYSSIVKPTDYFNTVTYAGNGSSPRSITGVGFQPDWVWTKNRSAANSNTVGDSVRGTGKTIFTDSTSAELTNNGYGYHSSFDADGFAVTGDTVSAGGDNVNKSGNNYVSWNWLGANGTASNTDGSITSTVSANTTAGFSIVSFTGTGANATIGHGLGVAPNVVITKNRDNARNWIYGGDNIAWTKYMILNLTNASASANNAWNDTAPTSSVVSLGSSTVTNESSAEMIAYCFAEKKGYSKFGSYTGNGNADGPFIYTGFKPAFVFQKRTDSTSNWHIFDNKREPENVMDKYLAPNDSGAEGTATGFDFLSNGFKSRTSSHWNNQSGGTYIYMAFAEEPLVANVGQSIPATAR
jgi:hypothetical protein